MADFFSLDGFDYLLKSIRGNVSKGVLSQQLAEVYTSFNGEQNVIDPVDRRKSSQYEGIIRIINQLGIRGNILEVGCGNGKLAKILAERYGVEVLGLDRNAELQRKQRDLEKPGNLSFEVADAFETAMKDRFGLVLGLHCCGNLADRVIDYAVASSADVVCVPCCYGLINKQTDILPRSAELSRRRDEFKYLIKRARALNGYVSTAKNESPSVISELCRRLIDFDRIFYLRENRYQTYFVKISGRVLSLPNRKKQIASPLREAIAGKK